MSKFTRLTLFTFMIFSSLIVSADTTSNLRGKVIDSSGDIVANADIVLTYGPTNTSQSVSTGDDGNFAMLNLQLGGPYLVKATSGGASGSIEDLFLALGKDSKVVISIGTTTEMDEMVVIGANLSSSSLLATGPSVYYGLEALEGAASSERDIKDLLATHPRLSLDEGYARGIQCNGSSPRMNSLTVDGIAMNDGFGLNDNGYPANRMPFSYDAIKQVSAEFAPFDVQYGGFSACVVNAVTKSGSNEFKGNFFYEFTNDDLLSDKVDGNSITNTPFDEDKYGFTLGGPIIQDKLYFFTAYEKYNDQDTVDYGPVGSGAPVEMAWLTQETLDLVTSTMKTKYGFDPGGIPAATDSFSEKLLVKLDYYLSDITRATFTYNHSEGFKNNYSDTYYTQLELANHGYTNGNTLDAYMFNLYSKIGDINTEVRVGYRELDNEQKGIGGPFGEFDIENVTGGGDIMVGGTDDSRQANALNYDNFTMAFVGDYLFGDQLISFGYEYETQDTFNMFVQHSLGGEWDFYSFDNFLNGIVDRVYYGNNPSLNPADAGATWTYDISTLFAQSEWTVSDFLEVTYGVRYEKYGVDGAPQTNPAFQTAYGRPNTHTHDGETVLMPRVSFSLNLDDSTEVYGGIGTFSGGNPNVWYSNIWSNDGVSNIQLSVRNVDMFNTPMCDGRTGEVTTAGPGYGVPCSLVNDVINGSAAGGTNSIDPNFKIPTVNKMALGIIKTLDIAGVNDIILTADYIYAKAKDSAQIRSIGSTYSGASDFNGVPLYNSNGREDFELGNSLLNGESNSWSIALTKQFESVYLNIGYSAIDTTEVSPMTSAVAYSNFTNIASNDPNNPPLAQSNYNIPKRFTGSLRWTPEVFSGLRTKVSLYWTHQKGRPYSYAMDNFTHGLVPTFNDFYLLYVPTDASDSNVTFADGFNTTDFFAWADSKGLERGAFVARNSQDSEWFSKLDLKISQELPALRGGDSLEVYAVIRNLTNLLDDSKGVFKEASFPRRQNVVRATYGDGKYNYDRFYGSDDSTLVNGPSQYNIKIGFDYKF